MSARSWIRRLVESTGYRITHLAANRFDAMEQVLQRLQRLGFTPQIVIDAGANVGLWTTMARRVFPDAEFHLVEPQPACRAALEGLTGRVHIHPVAVTRPGIGEVRMAGAGTTGAWIVGGGSAVVEILRVPASTLDALIGDTLSVAMRPLLKLDLEGHELAALEGATTVLGSVEVIISEVHFFNILDSGLTVFRDLARFLDDRGFDVYDVAALSSRPSDGRLRTGDVVFVRRGSPLLRDVGPD